MIHFIVLTLLVSLSLPAWAQEELASPSSGGSGVFTSVGFLFKSYKADRSETTDVSNLLYDLRLGYQFAGSYVMNLPAYVALVYSNEQDQVSATNYPTVGNDLKQTDTRTSTALLVGINKGRFYSAFGYVFSSTWTTKNDSSKVEYKDAVGIQLEVGANFALSSSLSIGPRISYRNITFSKQSTDGTSSSLSPKLTREYIDPNFVVKYQF